ncbi:MAG: MATE family efflux transporter [Muribaculaceae bacterium]|nr:MATE family efflux transporter [Muribaculaceae bacterium]
MNPIASIAKFFSGNARTVLLKKNIIGSLLLKGISIIISFLVVRMTIDFVNPTQYGIWLALSSLMAWFFFFDIGFTHGFRNRFAEAKALGNTTEARILTSTTYASLTIIIAVGLAIILPVNIFVDWSSILEVDPSYRHELSRVFMLLISFFGINMILQVFSALVTADQRPVLASLINVLGQAFAFLTIFILTRTVRHGNLIQLALAFSGVPVLVLGIISIFMFHGRYRAYRPSFRFVRFSYVKNILGIGGQFFVITTAMLLIFQLMNIIISREIGPDVVTQYNVSYKYFNILYMVALIVITPFWSAFTDAYTRGNFDWMASMLRNMERLWLASIPCVIIMILFAGSFFALWLDDVVTVPVSFNIALALYVELMMLANIYMYMINGTGKVRLQLIIYVAFAIVAYPVMTFCCRQWSIPGLLLLPTLVYLFQAVAGRIQIKKIIRGNATGIWNR